MMKRLKAIVDWITCRDLNESVARLNKSTEELEAATMRFRETAQRVLGLEGKWP